MSVSNRSLVAANQQLRIQLAISNADVSRLQNEIVDLQRRIADLESANDEERIEMIVRRRLQVYSCFFCSYTALEAMMLLPLAKQYQIRCFNLFVRIHNKRIGAGIQGRWGERHPKPLCNLLCLTPPTCCSGFFTHGGERLKKSADIQLIFPFAAESTASENDNKPYNTVYEESNNGLW